MSGLASLMEHQTGESRYLPTVAADKTCALTAAHAILAALFARERSGRGSFVEIPMFESMVGFNLVEHLYGQHFEPPLADAGYPRVLAPWRRPYRTRDGHVCMMPYTDTHWGASSPRWAPLRWPTTRASRASPTARGTSPSCWKPPAASSSRTVENRLSLYPSLPRIAVPLSVRHPNRRAHDEVFQQPVRVDAG
jgi:crotonobetainyl-CoA:carnitine CoA-transferase CaiB-like acyl-CoA transferase